MEEEKVYELIVIPTQRWYPKSANVDLGAWQICSARVVGNPKKEYIDYNFKKGEITIVGNLPFDTNSLMGNDQYKIRAIKKYNEKYKAYQYEVAYCQLLIPLDTIEDKKSFLSTFLTERQMTNLYKALDEPFVAIANMQVEELCKASGIGQKTANDIINKFLACQDEGVQFSELIQLGLTPNIIRKLKEYYKSIDTALHKVKNDPYSLVEVDGVGFAKADDIARRVGIGELDTKRVKGYILHHFQEEAESGHSYSPMSLLEDKAMQDLGLEDMCILDDAIEELIENGKLLYLSPNNEDDEGLVTTKKNYEIEQELAYHLQRLMNAPSNIEIDRETLDRKLKPIEDRQGWQFTEEQKQAMLMIGEYNVAVITARAGSGKTASVAGILACLDRRLSI